MTPETKDFLGDLLLKGIAVILALAFSFAFAWGFEQLPEADQKRILLLMLLSSSHY